MSRLTFELDRGKTAPRRARLALARFDHGLDGRRTEDAELLLSEVVSNAVTHGEGATIGVRFDREDDRFRAEVVDEGTGFLDRLRDRRGPRGPGGWGLPLVETLSDRWGAYEGSTRVWFELALP